MTNTHAVVLGASMAGLSAAAALAARFDTVTVVDRDTLPSRPANRKGVPQGRHLHGLLPGGRESLERLLPGLTDDLCAAGAQRGDLLTDTNWYIGGGLIKKHISGIEGLLLSRPLLEHAVRERVRSLPNVRLHDRTEVREVITDAGRRRVTGVRVAGPDGETMLDADLVVDATGRGSRMPIWLESWGYAAPRVERVEIGVTYLTRHYRLPAGALDERMSVVAPADGISRFGVISIQEDGSHIVTIGGYLGVGPERDQEAVLQFAGTLVAPDLYKALREAEPIDDFVPARFPASQRHRYDKLRDLPERLVTIGDSIASFNPMYGQGMTVAALEAEALGECLDAGIHRLARRFFKRAHKINDVAWQTVVCGDLRNPDVPGKRTMAVRGTNAFLDRVHRSAQVDEDVAAAFMRVAAFLAPPQSLFSPRILRRLRVGR